MNLPPFLMLFNCKIVQKSALKSPADCVRSTHPPSKTPRTGLMLEEWEGGIYWGREGKNTHKIYKYAGKDNDMRDTVKVLQLIQNRRDHKWREGRQ